MSIIDKITTAAGETHYRVRTDLRMPGIPEYSTPLIARTAVEQAWAEHALSTYRLACEVRLLVNALDSADGALIDEDDLRAVLKERMYDLVAAIWTLGSEGSAASDRNSVNAALDELAERADKAYRAAEDTPENKRPRIAGPEMPQ